ncbi:uncharacterized protein LOC127442860 [Myxocyprinus asiaticus]|uniref:uncharacterized protein LOC127442860 n=1 Tax=Myxocyprinus asiaticus TaxID=70543 RepID=UPI002223A1B1|nr:uncharacterized protein LOC127442860 [Myxocyprinus asiaticus]
MSTSRITCALKRIPVICYNQFTQYRRKTQRNPNNLRPLCTSAPAPLSFSVGLWNCQSTVNKVDFILAFATQSTLSILALTETCIHPEDTATSAALSNNFSFSFSPSNSNILVTPLHVSDHYFVQFNMTLPSILKHTPPLVSFRCNLFLFSLSPSHLATAVSTSLPTQNVFSTLDVNTATDTLSSTSTTCLDSICPLSSRPEHMTPPSPWLSDILREYQTDLRMVEMRWRKSKDPADLEQAAG